METVVTTFNGQLGATYTPGITVQTYEIYWTNSKVYFVVNGELLHVVSASLATWSTTMSFHIFADSLNSGSASNVTIGIRTSTIYRLGRSETRPLWKYETANVTAQILKRGGGMLHSVINASNNGTLTLYDALTATNPITVLDLTRVLGSINFDLDFYTGLCYTTTGGPRVTIVYE